MKSNEGASLFLAQGQLRASEASQEMLDAWNRANGYTDSGSAKLDDWEQAEKASKILLRPTPEGDPLFVRHDGTKYVFRDNLEFVDG